ncbi:hypothetical protein LguiB_030721 [Lonicera macranthoides]
MTKGRAYGSSKKRYFGWILILATFLGFLYVYSQTHGASSIEYSGKSLRNLGSYWGSDVDPRAQISAEEEEDNVILKSIPVCDDRHSELIPCLDRNLLYQTRLKVDLNLMEHYERHCPQSERRYNCLIPPPPGYRVPIRWPKSRDKVWTANIPHTHLADEKSDQRWMIVKGEKISFPGGGTHFHAGADKYIIALANMLGFKESNINNHRRIRTVFDVGCGVASFGAYLLPYDVITMSLAPNDGHENQIQFALERGIPAHLGVLGTKRLPYPSRSFDFAHCSRCRIDWLQRDGILLFELDRLLRPGAYFAYSSPEAYAEDEEDLRIWKEMSSLAERMCWKIAAKKKQTVIWIKPIRNDYDHRVGGSKLAPWPARLTTPPPRLADFSYSGEFFQRDTRIWERRVESYWNLLSPMIKVDTLRNLMDMKANIGSFAAALVNKDVWVMNVVPEDAPNTLKIVYDRGLIGTVHNWCQAFSTYPRTYDLLHAWTLLSDIEKKGCSVEDLLIEMDRVLRPKGFIIVRDKRPVVAFIKRYLKPLHWEGVAMADEPESEYDENEVVFVIRKKMLITSLGVSE